MVKNVYSKMMNALFFYFCFAELLLTRTTTDIPKPALPVFTYPLWCV